MRVLYITDYLPYPLISGDRIRVYNLLSRIARHHQVSLLALFKTAYDYEGLAHLRRFCFSVDTAGYSWRHFYEDIPGLIKFTLDRKPWELRLAYSSELASRIRQISSEIKFDVFHIENSRMALYQEEIEQVNCSRTILAFQNLAFLQYERISRIERNLIRKIRSRLFSFSMKRWEPRYAQKFNCCLTVSKLEKKKLLELNPALNVKVIPNGVDIDRFQPIQHMDSKPDILFVGTMDYSPGADAALYFCSEIFPLIRNEIKEAQVWIVGNDPPRALTNLSENGIHIMGRVDDVHPFYEKCSVCVVPLRAGGGTRIKILEAMALGRPVVTTSIGCEGLDVQNGKHLLVSDDPKEFAQKVVSLFTDRDLYKQIAANARSLVTEKYGWDAISQELLEVYGGQSD